MDEHNSVARYRNAYATFRMNSGSLLNDIGKQLKTGQAEIEQIQKEIAETERAEIPP